MSADVRTIEFAESDSVDFSTNKWVLEPRGDYKVGAGYYMLVPVSGLDEFERLCEAIKAMRAQRPESENESG